MANLQKMSGTVIALRVEPEVKLEIQQVAKSLGLNDMTSFISLAIREKINSVKKEMAI